MLLAFLSIVAGLVLDTVTTRAARDEADRLSAAAGARRAAGPAQTFEGDGCGRARRYVDEDIVCANSSAPMMPCSSPRSRRCSTPPTFPISCSTSNMSVLEGSIGILPRRILVRRVLRSTMRASCSRRPDSATSFVPMPALTSTAGCRARRQAAAQAAQARASGRPRRHPAGGGMPGARAASASSISGRASARQDWRSRCALRARESRWSRSMPVSPRSQPRMRSVNGLAGAGAVPPCSMLRRRRAPSRRRGSRLNRWRAC